MLNRDLFTYILSFMQKNEIKKLVSYFRSNVHYNYINPTIHTLVYGEVQSGKTRKIMDYIQMYRRELPKIVIIQNNLFMLNQYIKSLKHNRISYKVVMNSSCRDDYNQEQVLLILNNKFRMGAMAKYMNYNKYSLKSYCLILDEADQYIKKIQKNLIYQNAVNVLHVTATPFYLFDFDNVVKLKPPSDYIGINNINIKETLVDKYPQNLYVTRLRNRVHSIIEEDFMKQTEGIMLITCFRFVTEMKYEALNLSSRYSDTVVIVITSKIFIYLNGAIYSTVKNTNLTKLFDKFKGHIILIANRLSNRGFNYTNSNYTKYITHQISVASNNYTSFIQKCRIFGNRPTETKPILYCIINDDTMFGSYINKLKSKVAQISQPKVIENMPKQTKITVRELKHLCKQNNIKRYSKLKKSELLELLQEHQVDIN